MKELFKLAKTNATQLAILLTVSLLLAGCSMKADADADKNPTTAKAEVADNKNAALDKKKPSKTDDAKDEKADTDTDTAKSGDDETTVKTSKSDNVSSDSTSNKKTTSESNRNTGNSDNGSSKEKGSDDTKTGGGNTENKGNGDSGKNPDTGKHNGNNGGSGNNGSSGNTGNSGSGNNGNSGSTGNGGSGNDNTPDTPKPHKHSYTPKVTKSATCDKDGVKTYTCACGDSYTEKIKATGHHWEDVYETVWVKDDPEWVVDKEAEDVIVGYNGYYICTGCNKMFYDKDFKNGIDGSHHAAYDHSAYCVPGASVSRGNEAIWEHHDEVGHWEERGHNETKVTGQKCTVCGLIK